LIGPENWMKIFAKAKSKKKADKKVEELRKKGYKEDLVVIEQADNKFAIATFDENGFKIFDELNKKIGYKNIQCFACGKMINENNFFRCFHCGYLECSDCGKKRLFNNEIPIIHICGRDNFEFLANIGPCKGCGEPLTFRSAPQLLRMRMIGKITIGRTHIYSMGLIGCFLAEKVFIEKELDHTISLLINQLKKLKDSHNNIEIWLQNLEHVTATFNRIGWSASYIIENVDPLMLKRRNVDMYGYISNKLRVYLNECDIILAILNGITNYRLGSIPKEKYLNTLSQILQLFETQFAEFYNDNEREILRKLIQFDDNILDNGKILEILNDIETIITPKISIEIHDKFPSTLIC